MNSARLRAANGSYQDLGIFGVNPSALAINDLGRVLIGTYDDVHLIFYTYISCPGSTSLEVVPPLIPNGLISPSDMNQLGAVVGSAYLDTQAIVAHAYGYFNGKTKDLGVLPGG